MENDKSFLGKGWGFPPTFTSNENGGVAMVENEEDIRQSLEILLNTNLGERVMLPEYGCDLQSYLFKSISNTEINFLKELIRSAIINYEPRVLVDDIFIDYSEYQEGIVRIHLDYTVETSNTRFNLVFPYYMVEGTVIPQLFQKQVAKNLTSNERE